MKRLDQYWYDKNPVARTLIPLSWLFYVLTVLRRGVYRLGLLRVQRIEIPVIIAGNISVGGSGKTPLVIWLVEFLIKAGFKPGIISRGYRGAGGRIPRHVRVDSDPSIVGDEAVLLARRTACPVVIAPDRADAARALIDRCDIIIADDGLQHYALARNIEIAVIDGQRRFGNGYLLPAGPLREPVSRLRSVDLLVGNGEAQAGEYLMTLQDLGIHNLRDGGLVRRAGDFKGERLHAVAGIGHPNRFFEHLKRLGLNIIEHTFADHHAFVPADIDFGGAKVIMTEKDAVKCRRFAQICHWYMPVQACLNDGFGECLLALLKRKTHG